MGTWEGGPGYRYSTPPGPPSSHHPGYTPPGTAPTLHLSTARHTAQQMVVGLILDDGLSLSTRFSGSRGITEVYNLF